MKQGDNSAQSSGYTLVELMIVVAVIGILAAVALPQYNSYRHKAKASKLIDYARSCAVEQVAACQSDNTVTTSLSNLGNCSAIPVLSGQNVTINPDADSDLRCDDLDVTATVNLGKSWQATCTGKYDTAIRCTLL